MVMAEVEVGSPNTKFPLETVVVPPKVETVVLALVVAVTILAAVLGATNVKPPLVILAVVVTEAVVPLLLIVVAGGANALVPKRPFVVALAKILLDVDVADDDVLEGSLVSDLTPLVVVVSANPPALAPKAKILVFVLPNAVLLVVVTAARVSVLLVLEVVFGKPNIVFFVYFLSALYIKRCFV